MKNETKRKICKAKDKTFKEGQKKNNKKTIRFL